MLEPTARYLRQIDERGSLHRRLREPLCVPTQQALEVLAPLVVPTSRRVTLRVCVHLRVRLDHRVRSKFVDRCPRLELGRDCSCAHYLRKFLRSGTAHIGGGGDYEGKSSHLWRARIPLVRTPISLDIGGFWRGGGIYERSMEGLL